MPRYNLENFSRNLARLQEYLDRNDPTNLCATFDIGTKATKLLVGPKKNFTKETWNNSAFFNDGQLFPLGSDYDLFRGRLDIKSSGALEGVCYFVETYRTLLSQKGVPVENMHGVGTAVFRWMNNQKEVVSHIRNYAGFDIHILKPEDEAFFSGLAIHHTYKFGATSQETHGDNDVILLFDQGGGSTEVSYFYPTGNPKGEHVRTHDSLHSFGTVSLQKMFFEVRDKNTEDSGTPDPTMNRNRISTQFAWVKDYLVERVADWPGFPELGGDKVRIHAYGMGTALSKCLGRGNNFVLHNRVLTIRDMDETLDRQCKELDNSSQQVRTLFGALKKEQAARGKALSDRLVMLYGLPVYQELLRKFGLDRLRFAGFGLRYGVYFGAVLGLKFDEFLSASKADDSSMKQPEPIQVFLSHSSADNALAKRICKGLKDAGYGVYFYEAEKRAGKNYVAEISKQLSNSQFVAVMFSKESVESPWVEEEWTSKFKKGMDTGRQDCVLPILVDDCEVPDLLSNRNHADFRTDYDSGLKELLKTLNEYK